MWHTWGGEVHTGIRYRNLRERDHLENLRVDGRITLKWIFKKLDGGIDWIDQAHGSDRWRASANAVMNHWVQ